MTNPSAGEPDRPAGEPHGAETPAESIDPELVSATPAGPGPEPLSDKPVLEWTTEDWARWIEEPALPSPAVHEAAAEESTAGAPLVVAEEPGLEADRTATWSVALDEDEDEEGKWWSAVAGLVDVPSVAPPPPDLPPSPPDLPPSPPDLPPPPPDLPPPPVPAPPVLPQPPAPAPPVVPRQPAPAPPVPPGPPPPASPPPAVTPLAEPQPPRPEEPPRGAQPPRPGPEPGARSRSPQPRHRSLEPAGGDDMVVRVRAGLSLLGVSLLVGAVAAGLITVAIFMASVVLRRALG